MNVAAVIGGGRAGSPGRAKRRRLREAAIEAGITAVAMTGIAAVVLIFVFVAKEALPILLRPEVRGEASPSKMFLPQVLRQGRAPGFMWQPVSGVPKVSMIPLFLGTLKTTFVAMLAAVPIGVAAALFSAEFAPRRVREVVKPVIEMLAGIPSVVVGFFALMVMASALQAAFGFTFRLNAVVAGLALALTIVPVVFTVAVNSTTILVPSRAAVPACATDARARASAVTPRGASVACFMGSPSA